MTPLSEGDSPQARDARYKKLRDLGYSAPVARALAEITDLETRDYVAALLPSSGIADGPARGYLASLVAHRLDSANARPGVPPKLRPRDAAIVEARATQITTDALGALPPRHDPVGQAPDVTPNPARSGRAW